MRYKFLMSWSRYWVAILDPPWTAQCLMSKDPVPEASSEEGLRGRPSDIFVVTLLFGIVNLALSPLLARSLGPVGRGRQSVVAVVDDFSSAAFLAGVPQAAGYYAKLGQHDESALLSACIRFGLLASPLSLTIGALVSLGPLRGYLDTTSAWLTFFLIAASPLFATTGVTARQLLISRGDLLGIRNVYLWTIALRAMPVGAAYALHELTLPVAILALSYSAYFANIYALIRLNVRPTRRSAPLGRLLRYGIKSVPSALSQLSSGRIDQLLLAALVDTRLVGLYATAVMLNFAIFQLGSSFGIKAYAQAGPSPEQLRRAAATVRDTWCLTLVMGLVLLAFSVSGALGLVFGTSFGGAALPTVVLLPGTVLYAVGVGVLGSICQGLGCPGWNSAGQVIALLVDAAALLVLVPFMHLAGAALASTLASLCGFLVIWTGARRAGLRGIRPTWKHAGGLAKRIMVAVRGRLRP